METTITTTTTVTIKSETTNKIWMVKLAHKKNEFWNDWEEFHLFYNLEEAQKFMHREVKTVGRNMLKRHPIDTNFYYLTDDEGYEASFILRDNKEKKEIDRYEGWIYLKEIY